jgi:hypothetical protein
VSDRDYGLFINGEFVEPASGQFRDLVEPGHRPVNSLGL